MSPVGAGSEIGSFVVEKNIGSGAFASVWKVHPKISPHIVAIKVISKEGITAQWRIRAHRKPKLIRSS